MWRSALVVGLLAGLAGGTDLAGTIDQLTLGAHDLYALDDTLDDVEAANASTPTEAPADYTRPLSLTIVSAVLIVAAGVGVRFIPEMKTTQVMVAVLTGITTGIMCSGLTKCDLNQDWFCQWMFLPGSVWLKALKVMVLPLIIFAMIDSMVMLRSLPGARTVALTVVGLYTATTALAATEGCLFAAGFLSNVDAGGSNGPVRGPCEPERPPLATWTVLETFTGLVKNLVPANFVMDASKNNFLPLIVFSLAFGALVKDKENEDSKEKSTVLKCIDQANDVVLQLVTIIMTFTPYGVGSLVFQALCQNDINQVGGELLWLVAAVVCGLSFHAFVVYPTLLTVFAGVNPVTYISNVIPAMLIAMGTASSAATLPKSIEVAKERNGIKDHIADFVLTLGATINMDGTGLYLICAVYFMARMQGFPFGVDNFILLAVLATLTSAGAAPVPSASLVLLATILDAMGMEYIESHFGLILMIDWFLDRMRTIVNVIGDSTVTGIVNARFGGDAAPEVDDEDMDNFHAMVSQRSARKGEQMDLSQMAITPSMQIKLQEMPPGKA